jgi:hypothetical protein
MRQRSVSVRKKQRATAVVAVVLPPAPVTVALRVMLRRLKSNSTSTFVKKPLRRLFSFYHGR